MEAIKVTTILQEDGRLVLENLPTQKGDHVEIIILVDKPFLLNAQVHTMVKPEMEEDPLLRLTGLGKQSVDPDEYIRQLRAEWE